MYIKLGKFSVEKTLRICAWLPLRDIHPEVNLSAINLNLAEKLTRLFKQMSLTILPAEPMTLIPPCTFLCSNSRPYLTSPLKPKFPF